MSTILTISSLTAKFPWDYQASTNWGAANDNNSNFSFTAAFAQGTAAGQCDVLWVDKNTLTGGASRTLTLSSGGGLLDIFGAAIGFARVKAIWFQVLADTTSTGATLGNATLHPFGTGANGLFDAGTDTLSTGNPGLIFLVKNTATGWPVATGTADQLKILNADGTNTLTYAIAIAGCSV